MYRSEFFKKYSGEINWRRSDRYETKIFKVPDLMDVGQSLTKVIFLHDGTLQTEEMIIEKCELQFTNITIGQEQIYTNTSKVKVGYHTDKGLVRGIDYGGTREDKRITNYKSDDGYVVIVPSKDIGTILNMKLSEADETVSEACQAWKDAQRKMGARKESIRALQAQLENTVSSEATPGPV